MPIRSAAREKAPVSTTRTKARTSSRSTEDRCILLLHNGPSAAIVELHMSAAGRKNRQRQGVKKTKKYLSHRWAGIRLDSGGMIYFQAVDRPTSRGGLKMTKSNILAALSAAAMLALPFSAATAQPAPQPTGPVMPLEYAVKFVCGTNTAPGASTSLVAL